MAARLGGPSTRSPHSRVGASAKGHFRATVHHQDQLPHRYGRPVVVPYTVRALGVLAEEYGVLHGRVNLEGSPFTHQVRAAWGIPEPEPEVIIVRPLTPDELANMHRTGHIVDFGRSPHDLRRPLRDW